MITAGVAKRVVPYSETTNSEDLRLMADCAPVAMWVAAPDSNCLFVNRSYAEFLGMPQTEAVRHQWCTFAHPDDAEHMRAATRTVTPDGTPVTALGRFRRHDGAWHWMEVVSQPRYDSQGRHIGFVGAAQDVTAREAGRQTAIDELNHRVKNTLAIIQSLAQQSLKSDTDPETAYRAFEGRLQAFVRAHNLLTREHWGPVPLGQVIDEAMAPHDKRAFCLSGPLLAVQPKAAISLALAVHELATNAAQYGALSQPEGRVAIDWSATDRLRLRWAESGGPHVAVPARRGFGTRMIERGLSAELQGKARIEFAPAGVICTVDAPLPEACP